jgi:hypothetical protein
MSTYWVAFDLDQTIGCFESIHSYLVVYFPDLLQEVFKAPYYSGPTYPKLDISPSDKKRLATAFGIFVKSMATYEYINKLLRPGIIPILNLLLKAKKRGLVGGMMIYSNNSNPYMLLFAHELIKAILGVKEDIFEPLVHWWHPLRNKEVRGATKNPLSHGPKTVETIRAAFSSWHRPQISSSQILFFDDMIHENIMNIIPSQNYFHVQPYHHHGDVLTMNDCFKKSLIGAGFSLSSVMFLEFRKIGINTDLIIDFKGGRKTDVFDTGVILNRLSKIFNMDAYAPSVAPYSPASYSPAVFSPLASSKGGSTRRRRRRRGNYIHK